MIICDSPMLRPVISWNLFRFECRFLLRYSYYLRYAYLIVQIKMRIWIDVSAVCRRVAYLRVRRRPGSWRLVGPAPSALRWTCWLWQCRGWWRRKSCPGWACPPSWTLRWRWARLSWQGWRWWPGKRQGTPQPLPISTHWQKQYFWVSGVAFPLLQPC